MSNRLNYEIFCHVSDETLSSIEKVLRTLDNSMYKFGKFPCFAVKSSLQPLKIGSLIMESCQLEEGESFMVQMIKSPTTFFSACTIVYFANGEMYYPEKETSYIASRKA